jgi:hypothetical protein
LGIGRNAVYKLLVTRDMAGYVADEAPPIALDLDHHTDCTFFGALLEGSVQLRATSVALPEICASLIQSVDACYVRQHPV